MKKKGYDELVVTVSGVSGAGKTTCAEIIVELFGLRYVSAGMIFRKMASERGMSIVEFSLEAEKDEAIDRLIDDQTLREASFGGVVLDGRLTGIMVGEKADLRGLVVAPFEERVKRIAERDGVSFEEAREQTLKREFSEVHRYKKLYGADINDVEKYDIVLNTAKFTPEKIKSIIKTTVENLIRNNGKSLYYSHSFY